MSGKEMQQVVEGVVFSPSHQMAIKTSRFIALVGWIFALIGTGSFVLLLISGGLGLIIVPLVVVIFTLGLFLAVAGQTSVAIMNNAGYSKQILIELQKQNKPTLTRDDK